MGVQKENEMSLDVKLKLMEGYALNNREFKIAVRRSSMRFKGNLERHFSEPRKKIALYQRLKLKKKGKETLELKNSNEMKNALESTGHKAD